MDDLNTVIPTPTVTDQFIQEWEQVKKQLSQLKQREAHMRHQIVRARFPELKEGTNTVPLANGWVMKAKHTITRDVDIAVLTQLSEQMREQGIPMDSLIAQKPTLVTSEYRKLEGEQRMYFEQALVIKPGSTALEITFSKAEAKKLGINTEA